MPAAFLPSSTTFMKGAVGEPSINYCSVGKRLHLALAAVSLLDTCADTYVGRSGAVNMI